MPNSNLPSSSTRISALRVCVAAFVLGAAFLAPASAGETVFAKVGPWLIHKISNGNAFDRCAATLNPGPGMLRIAYTKSLDYSISVPATPSIPHPQKIKFDLGRGPGYSYTPDYNQGRVWAKVDPALISDYLDKAKGRIVIFVDRQRFLWTFPANSFDPAMMKLEDCTQGATRGNRHR